MANGYEGKSDHDLLILAVVRQDNMIQKLDKVCNTQEAHESRLKTIETEHKMRMAVATCYPNGTSPQYTYISLSKKKLIPVASGGLGLITIVIFVLDRLLTKLLGG